MAALCTLPREVTAADLRELSLTCSQVKGLQGWCCSGPRQAALGSGSRGVGWQAAACALLKPWNFRVPRPWAGVTFTPPHRGVLCCSSSEKRERAAKQLVKTLLRTYGWRGTWSKQGREPRIQFLASPCPACFICLQICEWVIDPLMH